MTTLLEGLGRAGVSVWLDDLSRTRLSSGTLAKLAASGVVGVTTNPSIFQAALSHGTAYDAQVAEFASRGVDVGEAVRMLTAADVRAACDVFAGVYEESNGLDGRVSIEVDPRISRDPGQTYAEAKALWWLVDRPNLYIKIPATRECLPAITRVLGEGISVNVTLIFSLQRYREVMDAFMAGIELAHQNGHQLSRLDSVASFFISRVDTLIDAQLGDTHAELHGKAALANARLAFEAHEEAFSSQRWSELSALGARVQRPLWASTGVKNPAYDPTLYVTELVTAGVVNTMPEATLDAVRASDALPSDTIVGRYEEARALLAKLEDAGIEFDAAMEQLEQEGLKKFEDAWNELLTALREQLAQKPSPAQPAAS